MDWTHITSTQDDESFFEDYCRIALACEPPKLPERIQRLGAVAAGWFPTLPGTAHIFAEGGTPLDRAFAYQVIAAQLEGHDIEPATYTFHWDLSDKALIKEANWDDIMAGATRLIKGGKVHILRNSAQYIASHVEGDHGDYECEIQRIDPNSQSISMWDCTCPWNQYAWGRTRKWKRLEGRPCFFENSQVSLTNGEFRNIQDMSIGDQVLTNGGPSRVTGVWQNTYDGPMLSFKRKGSSDVLTVTADHKMLVNTDAQRENWILRPKATRAYHVKKTLRNESKWKQKLAKDVIVGDWVKLAYPTEVQDFDLDVLALSPYLHLDRNRVYKSVYARDDPKIIQQAARSVPSHIDLSDDGIAALEAKLQRVGSHLEWRGSIDTSTRQSRFTWRGKQYNVRKVIWALERGNRSEGSRIMPQCSNVACVDPDHMKVKTQTERLGQRAINTLPMVLGASDALLTIAGYYLAEGSFANNDCEIEWTFNINEEGTYVERLDQAIQELNAGVLRRYRRAAQGRITVKLANAVLVQVLKYLCGCYSRQKHLSQELMLMAPERQKFFLDRYGEGDGHIVGPRMTICTASDVLAHQIVQMGCRIYDSIPVSNRSTNSGGPTNRTKVSTINHIALNQAYNVGLVRLKEGFYAAQITDIQEFHHEGPVYNLTVPPTYTVAVEDIVSFQCKHVLATYWVSLSMPLDEDIGPGAEPQGPEGGAAPPGASEQPAPEPQASPFAQVPGGGTGMVPPAGTPGPQKPGMPNQTAPMPEPAGGVPGQAPEPPSLIPQYPHDPALQPAVNPVSVPGLKPQTPLNPIQNPGGTFSHVHESAESFVNGEMVSNNQADFGQTVGLNGGETKEVPANSVGEVLGTDPLGLIQIYFAGPQAQAGNLQPHGVTMWAWPKDIRKRPDIRPPGPAIRRR